ncbi:MAG: ABC transporter substrate-binding protein [Gemmatimonadaceae bacterium]
MSHARRSVRCALLALVALACGDAEQQAARTKIRVVTQPYLALAPIHIAVGESLFAKHGLDVELVPMAGPMEAVPLLIGGQVDVLSSSAQAGVFNAAARGDPIRAVAERGYYDSRGGCSHLALVVRRGLDSARIASSVKRLSYDRQAAMTYITIKMLARAGLTLEGLQGTTEVPHLAEIDALKNGKLDVAMTGEPWLSRTVAAGAGTVWIRAEDVAPNETFGYVFFGRNLLEKDREAGRRFMRAYREAIERYREGKTERNVEIIAAATGEEPELVRSACWASMRPDSRIDTAAMMDFQRWAHGRGLVQSLATVAQLWDSTFLAHADSAARRDAH